MQPFRSLLLLCLLSALSVSAQILPDSVWKQYREAPGMFSRHLVLRDYLAYAPPMEVDKKLQMLRELREHFLSRGSWAAADFLVTLEGGQYWAGGDYPAAIRTSMEVLPRLEERGDTAGILQALNSLAISYSETGNPDQAIVYLQRLLPFLKNTGNVGAELTILNNLADNYLRLGKNDSARWYIVRAQTAAEHSGKSFALALVYSTMGEVYLSTGELDLAAAYMHRAAAAGAADEDWATVSYNYGNLSRVFNRKHAYDSARYYGRRALELSEPSLKAEQLRAIEALLEGFRASGPRDSAYRYALLRMDLKDSLFNEARSRSIQQMHFTELLREQEKESRRKLDAQHRRQNLQTTAVAIFVITFLVFVVLLRRKNPNLKAIRFMGILAVLLLFEFVSMLLHPWLEKITHHHPLWMLFGLVCIGAVIAPLHHRMTLWIQHKTGH